MIVTITENGQLNLPPEIQNQVQSGDKYEVSLSENSIIFKKVPQSLDWLELSRRIESLGEDPDQSSLQELSEIVKEVRRERRLKNQL